MGDETELERSVVGECDCCDGSRRRGYVEGAAAALGIVGMGEAIARSPVGLAARMRAYFGPTDERGEDG